MNRPILTREKLSILNDALFYMKVDELKQACTYLSLPLKGKKLDLISRIITFLESGKIIECPIIPKESRANNYPIQSLTPDSLILYGSYKNDAKTRAFFKDLIGSNFHFTAFGIDWINDRWIKGNPPTYQEFANYWIEETKNRNQTKPIPKDEWKFIIFSQDMNKNNPNLSKKELMGKWQILQANKVSIVFEILKSLNTNSY